MKARKGHTGHDQSHCHRLADGTAWIWREAGEFR